MTAPSLTALVLPLRIARKVRLFNVDSIRVGGVRFVKIGRLCFSFSVSREFRPFTH